MYPYGELFAQTVGYQSVVVGSTGVEKEYTAVLSGRDRPRLRLRDLGDLLLGKQQTGNVVLSLRTDVQLVAKAALGNQEGSVVVTDPRTGATHRDVLEPELRSRSRSRVTTPRQVQAYWDLLQPNSPTTTLLPRAYRERYPPGSTFKIATTEAALDTGIDHRRPRRSRSARRCSRRRPGSRSRTSVASSCGGTLEESFVESCNTTFAQLGLRHGREVPAAARRLRDLRGAAARPRTPARP